MRRTLKELAQYVNGDLSGSAELEVTGIAGIREAKQGEITFLSNTRYRDQLQHTDASAVVLEEDMEELESLPFIRVGNADLAAAKMAKLFQDSGTENRDKRGVHPSAVVHDSAEIGEDVWVGPQVHIREDVEIGDDTVIRSGCYLDRNVQIGESTVLFPNVTILEDSLIGNEVEIHSNAVIGCEGFGYVQEEGEQMKIPQVGCVVIEDHVSIGSSTTIDRARFGETRIKEGVKIDNLVQIGHNVEVGSNVIMAAQCGIAGSVSIGENTMFGGRVGVADHVEVGRNVRAAAGAVITRDTSDGKDLSGDPARAHRKQLKRQSVFHRLPELHKELKKMREEIEQLKDQQQEEQLQE